MDFGLSKFQKSPRGLRVASILNDPETIRDMFAVCRIDVPAVRVVGRRLAALGIKSSDHQDKKLIGRWIRQILAQHGWTPMRVGKLPRGYLFSTGAIYRPDS